MKPHGLDILKAVSASLSKITIPEGFTRLSWNEFLAEFSPRIPDLAVELGIRARRYSNDNGWDVIDRLESEGVIAFAKTMDEPAIFTADAKYFQNSQDYAASTRLVEYFDMNGTTQKDIVTFDDWLKEFPLSIASIANKVSVSKRVVEDTLREWAQSGALKFFRRDNNITAVSNAESAGKLDTHAKREIWKHAFKVDDKPAKVDDSIYMRAIRDQYAVANHMASAFFKAKQLGIADTMYGVHTDEFGHVYKMLLSADTYVWLDEPSRSVEQAAVSLPDSVRLTKELTISECGWWYFATPLNVTTVSQDLGDPLVPALLWAWQVDHGKTGIYFSAFIHSPKKPGEMIPTTEFFWHEGTTLAHMLQHVRTEWMNQYGPGMKFEHMKEKENGGLLGLHGTLLAVEQMARFFASGCLWTQQKILSMSHGHIERHDRKRLARELKVAELKQVQVITLRRRQSVSTGEEGERVVNWSCRWIVNGHWRNQFYPSEGVYKPKYIIAYPKGPDHLPLKTPTHRVYGVSR